jgi:hypothetical protein
MISLPIQCFRHATARPSFISSIPICLSVFFVSCLVSGCGFVKSKNEASEIVEEYFDDRIKNQNSGDDSFYSKHFWDVTSDDEWDRLKALVDKALGPLKGYSLNTWNTQKIMRTDAVSGTYVALVYDTEYELGTGKESIVMLRPSGEEAFKIYGHRFVSDKIQAVIDEGIDRAISETEASKETEVE